LTTRFDQVDAALIFDHVVVPWERVFVYKDPTLLGGIAYIHSWGHYSTMLRLITKLEAFLGVAQLLSRYGRRDRSAASQTLLSSLMLDIEILRCCIQVAESTGYMSPGGTWVPLVAVAANMVMTPFGKRSQLYERLQSGEVDRMRQRLYSQYKDAAPAERLLQFVEAMGD
jgi:aromatic ring hydroxylase